MAEFTSRDKTIASLLNWGLCLLFAVYLIFVDGFRTVDRVTTELVRLGREGGLGFYEAQWFGCMALSVALFLWGRNVRKGLLRISPPWLGLGMMWLFCVAGGLLGFVFYLGNMFMIIEMKETVLAIVQGGILSYGFPFLAIGGMVRALPK